MPDIAITIILGILGGVAVGLQASMAGDMGRRIGGTATSFIIHIGGAILSGFLLLARGGEQIQNWRRLSWYMLMSGMFGVVLYLTLSRTIPRLGATAALILVIIGQLTIVMVIDHFGLFGLPIRLMDGWRILAAIFLITGGYMVMR